MVQILQEHFPDLTAHQVQQFEQLFPLYQEWNSKINVISRKDIDQLYTHHVLHSLAIAKFVQFLPYTEVLDVGTGGGFPGIPLAILFPEARFHLVDSIGKKIKVVEEVATGLQLQNVTYQQARVEQLPGMYDFVVSRAVAPLKQIMQWVGKKIVKHYQHPIHNGIICLKGGDLHEETREVKRKVEVVALNRYFQDPYFETKKLVYIPF
ncbi:16S rRNA (guanine527-N7)-methyltransferase [Catalinimonas alkaloidigena]|uniref:Ribosomal RNA small subunit methyltransferase G n=1 Tax=Catalinimonas alkaloidigena TaxID=1075417 RepID=A0A1G9UA12_9BACT|nr:16S rRNA (guanine(527)-N(7))-methyltransferase RsmG [Catalinimonas alkaloidigena]SDM56663.1 16S rRNA (guanine527-N7)-methyltransferase [Catalinimonas alkaloidigena]